MKSLSQWFPTSVLQMVFRYAMEVGEGSLGLLDNVSVGIPTLPSLLYGTWNWKPSGTVTCQSA